MKEQTSGWKLWAKLISNKYVQTKEEREMMKGEKIMDNFSLKEKGLL